MGGACSAQATRPGTHNSQWWSRDLGGRQEGETPPRGRPSTTTPESTESTHSKAYGPHTSSWQRKGKRNLAQHPFQPPQQEAWLQIPPPTQECESSVLRCISYHSSDQLYRASPFHPGPAEMLGSPCVSHNLGLPVLDQFLFCSRNELIMHMPKPAAQTGRAMT